MPYFVYIVECADGTYYTGCTNNPKRRVREHNHSRRGAVYTKYRRPVKLVFIEEYESLSEAKKREYEIKQKRRPEKDYLVNGG